MSTPPGSPDWQSTVQWRGPVLAATTVNVTSVAPFSVTQFVNSWASTYFGIQLNSGVGVTVTANWYTDSSKTVRMAQKVWVLNPGNFINQAIFNLGDFLEVIVSTGQAGNHSVFITVAENNLTPSVVTAPRGNALINSTGLAVANAATPQFVVPEVMDAQGILMVLSSVTNANLGFFIDPLLESGASQGHIVEAFGNTVAQFFEFVSITQPLAFIIHNFTGGAVIVDYSVMLSVRS